MNRVGVPSTWPDARPLSTSRWIRSSTVLLAPVVIECRHVQPELSGVLVQVAVFERLLAVEEQRVHVPEPVLPCGGLSCGRCGEGVRVDVSQREIPEREPHVPLKLLFYLVDRVERLPRVRALVIAVLDDQAAGGRAADVIDLLIQRRQGELAVVRYRVEDHGRPSGVAGRAGWPGSSETDRLADEDDVDAAGQLLVDLQDLPHLAVLPVSGLRPDVLQRQAVLIDPLMCRG